MKKIVFLFGLLSLSLFSQNSETSGFQVPNFSPKSPEAAAFLKYGEYPVDLSTGLPSISIPLYTIETNDFKVPISLNYHAAGIKVNQEATWVGLGWNLNCGAQIILSVRDDIDEKKSFIDQMPNDTAILENWRNHPYQFNSGIIESEKLSQSRVKDVYSFSSPTTNGSFYINNFAANDVVIFPPDAFKVNLLGATRGDLGFEIIDTSGNVYLFNATREISMKTLSHSDRYISAWYVDEIKTASNNKIEFIYQDDGIIKDPSFYQRIEVSDIIQPDDECKKRRVRSIKPLKTEESAILTNTKKIKEIIFNQGQNKVVFNKVNGRQDLVFGNDNGYLSTIEIKQLKNNKFERIKGFSFEYTYFESSDGVISLGYNNKRLKIDRIIDLNVGEEEHEFIYSDIKLPSKTSLSQDFYGYYNGSANLDLIPIQFIDPLGVAEQIGSANREINSNKIQAGILKEIHYPTKGWTKFNFEPNQYYGINAFEKYRIHTISSPIVQGAGTAQSPPSEYGDQVTYSTIAYDAINASGQVSFEMKGTSFNDPSLKHQYARVQIISGAKVVYDSGSLKYNELIKKVVKLDSSGEIRIKAYGDRMSIMDFQLKYGNNDPNPKNNNGPGLRIQSIENNDNNNFLSKKEYDYSTVSNRKISSGKLINELSNSFVSNIFSNYSYMGCISLESSEGGIGVVTAFCNSSITYNYTSNSRFGIEGNTITYRYVKEQLIDTKQIMNNGYTQYEFSTDADEIPFGDPTVQISTSWKRGKLLEKSIFKSIGSSNYLLRKEKNIYFEDDSKKSYIKGFKMFAHGSTNIIENPSNPLVLYFPFFADGGHTLSEVYEPITYSFPIPWFYLKNTEIIENFFDSSNALTGTITTTKTFNYNNPLHQQLSSQTVVSSLGETIETKYYYTQDSEMTGEAVTSAMIAKNMIDIPLNTQIFRAGQKLSEQKTVYANDATTSNLILPKYVYGKKGIDVNSVLEKKITYDSYDTNGILLQYTIEGNIPVSVIWGYYKTQPIAKIENTTYSQVSSYVANLQSLSEAGSEANLLKALTALRNAFPNAMVTTYTYKPLIGVSTITDPKNNTTYYEYDESNRLKLVKDAQENILSENQYHYKN